MTNAPPSTLGAEAVGSSSNIRDMSSVVALGYVCVCGERVRVFRLEQGQDNVFPLRVTVACPHGHAATFHREQVGLLELWDEEPVSAATATASGDEHEQAA